MSYEAVCVWLGLLKSWADARLLIFVLQHNDPLLGHVILSAG